MQAELQVRETPSTPNHMGTTAYEQVVDQTTSLPRPDLRTMDPTSDFNVDVTAPGVDVIDIPELRKSPVAVGRTVSA